MLSRRPGLDEPQSGPELGFRSKFVLAKIGHDLRERFDDVVSEPLPERFGDALARLGSMAQGGPAGERRQP